MQALSALAGTLPTDVSAPVISELVIVVESASNLFHVHSDVDEAKRKAAGAPPPKRGQGGASKSAAKPQAPAPAAGSQQQAAAQIKRASAAGPASSKPGVKGKRGAGAQAAPVPQTRPLLDYRKNPLDVDRGPLHTNVAVDWLPFRDSSHPWLSASAQQGREEPGHLIGLGSSGDATGAAGAKGPERKGNGSGSKPGPGGGGGAGAGTASSSSSSGSAAAGAPAGGGGASGSLAGGVVVSSSGASSSVAGGAGSSSSGSAAGGSAAAGISGGGGDASASSASNVSAASLLNGSVAAEAPPPDGVDSRWAISQAVRDTPNPSFMFEHRIPIRNRENFLNLLCTRKLGLTVNQIIGKVEGPEDIKAREAALQAEREAAAAAAATAAAAPTSRGAGGKDGAAPKRGGSGRRNLNPSISSSSGAGFAATAAAAAGAGAGAAGLTGRSSIAGASLAGSVADTGLKTGRTTPQPTSAATAAAAGASTPSTVGTGDSSPATSSSDFNPDWALYKIGSAEIDLSGLIALAGAGPGAAFDAGSGSGSDCTDPTAAAAACLRTELPLNIDTGTYVRAVRLVRDRFKSWLEQNRTDGETDEAPVLAAIKEALPIVPYSRAPSVIVKAYLTHPLLTAEDVEDSAICELAVSEVSSMPRPWSSPSDDTDRLVQMLLQQQALATGRADKDKKKKPGAAGGGPGPAQAPPGTAQPGGGGGASSAAPSAGSGGGAGGVSTGAGASGGASARGSDLGLAAAGWGGVDLSADGAGIGAPFRESFAAVLSMPLANLPSRAAVGVGSSASVAAKPFSTPDGRLCTGVVVDGGRLVVSQTLPKDAMTGLPIPAAASSSAAVAVSAAAVPSAGQASPPPGSPSPIPALPLALAGTLTGAGMALGDLIPDSILPSASPLPGGRASISVAQRRKSIGPGAMGKQGSRRNSLSGQGGDFAAALGSRPGTPQGLATGASAVVPAGPPAPTTTAAVRWQSSAKQRFFLTGPSMRRLRALVEAGVQLPLHFCAARVAAVTLPGTGAATAAGAGMPLSSAVNPAAADAVGVGAGGLASAFAAVLGSTGGVIAAAAPGVISPEAAIDQISQAPGGRISWATAALDLSALLRPGCNSVAIEAPLTSADPASALRGLVAATTPSVASPEDDSLGSSCPSSAFAFELSSAAASASLFAEDCASSALYAAATAGPDETMSALLAGGGGGARAGKQPPALAGLMYSADETFPLHQALSAAVASAAGASTAGPGSSVGFPVASSASGLASAASSGAQSGGVPASAASTAVGTGASGSAAATAGAPGTSVGAGAIPATARTPGKAKAGAAGGTGGAHTSDEATLEEALLQAQAQAQGNAETFQQSGARIALSLTFSRPLIAAAPPVKHQAQEAPPAVAVKDLEPNASAVSESVRAALAQELDIVGTLITEAAASGSAAGTLTEASVGELLDRLRAQGLSARVKDQLKPFIISLIQASAAASTGSAATAGGRAAPGAGRDGGVDAPVFADAGLRSAVERAVAEAQPAALITKALSDALAALGPDAAAAAAAAPAAAAAAAVAPSPAAPNGKVLAPLNVQGGSCSSTTAATPELDSLEWRRASRRHAELAAGWEAVGLPLRARSAFAARLVTLYGVRSQLAEAVKLLVERLCSGGHVGVDVDESAVGVLATTAGDVDAELSGAWLAQALFAMRAEARLAADPLAACAEVVSLTSPSSSSSSASVTDPASAVQQAIGEFRALADESLFQAVHHSAAPAIEPLFKLVLSDPAALAVVSGPAGDPAKRTMGFYSSPLLSARVAQVRFFAGSVDTSVLEGPAAVMAVRDAAKRLAVAQSAAACVAALHHLRRGDVCSAWDRVSHASGLFPTDLAVLITRGLCAEVGEEDDDCSAAYEAVQASLDAWTSKLVGSAEDASSSGAVWIAMCGEGCRFYPELVVPLRASGDVHVAVARALAWAGIRGAASERLKEAVSKATTAASAQSAASPLASSRNLPVAAAGLSSSAAAAAAAWGSGASAQPPYHFGQRSTSVKARYVREGGAHVELAWLLQSGAPLSGALAPDADSTHAAATSGQTGARSSGATLGAVGNRRRSNAGVAGNKSVATAGGANAFTLVPSTASSQGVLPPHPASDAATHDGASDSALAAVTPFDPLYGKEAAAALDEAARFLAKRLPRVTAPTPSASVSAVSPLGSRPSLLPAGGPVAAGGGVGLASPTSASAGKFPRGSFLSGVSAPTPVSPASAGGAGAGAGVGAAGAGEVLTADDKALQGKLAVRMSVLKARLALRDLLLASSSPSASSSLEIDSYVVGWWRQLWDATRLDAAAMPSPASASASAPASARGGASSAAVAAGSKPASEAKAPKALPALGIPPAIARAGAGVKTGLGLESVLRSLAEAREATGAAGCCDLQLALAEIQLLYAAGRDAAALSAARSLCAPQGGAGGMVHPLALLAYAVVAATCGEDAEAERAAAMAASVASSDDQRSLASSALGPYAFMVRSVGSEPTLAQSDVTTSSAWAVLSLVLTRGGLAAREQPAGSATSTLVVSSLCKDRELDLAEAVGLSDVALSSGLSNASLRTKLTMLMGSS